MKEMKFEEKMKRLQEIVSLLESGNTGLDESIELYEEGQNLSKELNAILKKYDEKITAISSGDSQDEQ